MCSCFNIHAAVAQCKKAMSSKSEWLAAHNNSLLIRSVFTQMIHVKLVHRFKLSRALRSWKKVERGSFTDRRVHFLRLKSAVRLWRFARAYRYYSPIILRILTISSQPLLMCLTVLTVCIAYFNIRSGLRTKNGELQRRATALAIFRAFFTWRMQLVHHS